MWNLAVNTENQVKIVEAGGIVPLVALGALATLAFLWNPLDIGLGYRARRPGDERLPIFDSSGLRAVLSAHASDARLWYLAPLTLGFGYSSALFTDWVDSVVDEERGDSTVALVSAITTITAGVAVFPVNAIFAYGGSRAPVALAVLAYGTLGALILGLGSLDRISEWSNLVAIFALQGVNRAIFENSTKFIFLDTFRGSGHVDAALASIYAHSGFASTVTFASLFSENIGLAGAALLLFVALIGASADHEVAVFAGSPWGLRTVWQAYLDFVPPSIGPFVWSVPLQTTRPISRRTS